MGTSKRRIQPRSTKAMRDVHILLATVAVANALRAQPLAAFPPRTAAVHVAPAYAATLPVDLAKDDAVAYTPFNAVARAPPPRAVAGEVVTQAGKRSWLRPNARQLLLSLVPAIFLATRLDLILFNGAIAAYHGYEAAALARPLITKAATSGVAYFLGDAIAQRLAPPKKIEGGRLFRATFAGAVSHGPQLHYWTLILERLLPGSGMRALLSKIALDQTLFSLYINGAFCLVTEAIQRKPLGEAFKKVRAAAWPCLIAGWRFWPLAHALTYSIIPLHLRVLWVDALEVAWVAILSTCVARSGAEEVEEICAPPAEIDGCVVEELQEEVVEAEEEMEGLVVPTAVQPTTPSRAGTAVMRDDGKSYIGASMDAWAKTAAERPAFFALRVVILSSGLFFFAKIALALLQRAL